MKNQNNNQDFHYNKCPVCRKRFYKYSDEWVYQMFYKNKYWVCCSYTCFRKVQKQKEADILFDNKLKGKKKVTYPKR